MRPLLAGLEKLYAVGVRARNARFDRQAPKSLRWPVISVGNLSVGGSGKTPLVILLAQLLAEAGWTPDVLSAGTDGMGARWSAWRRRAPRIVSATSRS